MVGLPKRVVYLSDSDGFGGAEEALLQFLRHLDRRKWQPVLFYHDVPAVPPLAERVDALGIRTVAVPRIARATHLGRLPAFVRALRAEAADIFHAQLTWPMSCRFGLIAARMARVPAIVATAHSRFDVLPIEAIQPRFIATFVDRYIAVAGGVAQQLRAFGIPSRKIVVVHNGIAPRPSTDRRSPSCLELASGDRPVVLTVARLEVRKGLIDLVRAAALVPNAVFIIAGEGPDRAAIEKQVSDAGVGDRMFLLGQRPDVGSLLSAADVFVLPSHTEGLPISILEAMVAGVPVIATDIPGVDELVASECSGLLVPPHAPAALASAIHRMLTDVDEARRMAAEASRRATEEFSVWRMVERVCATYDQVLTGSPTRTNVR